MKKVLSIVLLAIAVVTVAFGRPALAGTPAEGAKVFSANCAACHLGGNNVVMANKNLKKETLASFKMDSIEAITTQVTKGKNAMPAFGGRLSPTQIDDVASYVLDQAEKGWK